MSMCAVLLNSIFETVAHMGDYELEGLAHANT